MRTALTNVRVFDGERLTEPRTVVIDGEFIGDNAEGAQIVDGEGAVLLPGLIDAHIHLETDDDLVALATFGITTGLDMATWPSSKLDSLRARKGLTDIRSAGLPATCAGSIHSILLPLPKEALLDGPQDAERFVESRVSEGSDFIKLIVDVPGPDQDTLNALSTAAHRHQKLVVAHAASFIPFAMAQDAMVDVITHAPRDKALDEDAVARMVAENRISVPTLTMMEGMTKPPSWGMIGRLLLQPYIFWAIIQARRKNPHGGGQKYENARDSVTAMYRAGVPILAGTDANSEKGAPFSIKHGDSLHHELELLVDAGLSNVDALRAATSLPAQHFGLTDRGVIEVGKRADLVLISEDPLRDIRATRSILRVWCGGEEFKRS
jgi:imidazolonepropionase-like amidohydrolase